MDKATERLFSRGNGFLGTEYPILCGAMTWVSTPELVAAVSNAGAFAALAGGNMPPKLLDEAIDRTSALTRRTFAVNVITLGPSYKDHLALLQNHHVPFVVFAGGLPRDTEIAAIKATGAKVLCFASTEMLAQRLLSFGVDGLILEGTEAGGHIGHVSLTVLLQQVLFHCDTVPVFVAGGIATGRLMAHLLMLGAAGVQLGTRFAVARECNVHPDFKKALINASARDAQPAGQLDSGLPVVAVRALRNEGTREFERLQVNLIAQLDAGHISRKEAQAQVEHFWVGGLHRAAVDGDVRRGSVMAGQSVGLVDREESVADIIADLVSECDREVIRTRGILG